MSLAATLHISFRRAQDVIEVGITALIRAAEMPGCYTDAAVFFQLLLSLFFS